MAKTVLEKLGLKAGEVAAQLGCPADLLEFTSLPALGSVKGEPELLIGFVNAAADVPKVLAALRARQEAVVRLPEENRRHPDRHHARPRLGAAGCC
jgi:hypothetical protein